MFHYEEDLCIRIYAFAKFRAVRGLGLGERTIVQESRRCGGGEMGGNQVVGSAVDWGGV